MHSWWMNLSLQRFHTAESVTEFHSIWVLTLQGDLGVGFLEEMFFQWYFEYMKKKLIANYVGEVGGNRLNK